MAYRLEGGQVLPRCREVFEYAERGALLAAVSRHAAEAHGIASMTPEVLAAVDSEIVEV